MPVIVAGAVGALPGTTARDRAIEVPHVVVAVTDTEPDVLPGVTVIEFDVDDPDQPAGSVQV